MKALYERDANADIRFWGGDAMMAVGGTMVKHIRDLSFMGFVEVFRHIGTVLGNIDMCKRDIISYSPDAIIYIDFPGFNLRIAKFAHKHGFKNYYYISPQLWAWKKGRIRQMRRTIDRLFCILPFEEEFYKKNSFPRATYVGHPLLDAIDGMCDSKKEDETEKPLIAVLPGSRRQELAHVFPTMLLLAERHPEFQFEVAGMSLIGDKVYSRYLSKVTNVTVSYDQTYRLLSKAYAAVVCSGTATLETALFNVPQVVCYKANALSIAIARCFVGNRVRFISLVNLIADREIVKELLQQDYNITKLESEFERITKDESYRKNMCDGYAEVRRILGDKGASKRVAEAVTESINSRS